MTLSHGEQHALAALDETGLLQTLRELLFIPSVTGCEAEAQRWLAQQMRASGLTVDLWEIDVEELRRHADFPGMEVERAQQTALGLVGCWTGSSAEGRRLIFNGHIDVVPAGELTRWSHDPWGAEVEGDLLYGRGACDMKGGLVAALYALKALQESGTSLPGSLLLQSVIGEEDGGLGTYASLARGHGGDAALICEPTCLQLVPAQAGALTFSVRVRGKSAHACVRLEGVSAIEKYLDLHRALLQLEHERNRAVVHPLLSRLALPYPLSIGELQAGDWSSSVPEELRFVGRIGVAMGESPQSVREHFARVLFDVAMADPWLREHPPEIDWTGGQFASGEIACDHPLVELCGECLRELGESEPEIVGVPYGSDLRLLVNQGRMPALLCGPGDVRQAHTPDEYVHIAEIVRAARLYILVAMRYLQGMDTK